MSMQSVFVLGRITGSSKVSFKTLLQTLPAVISDEVDTGALICKRNKISFQGKKLIEALCLDNSFLENEISIATSETHYGEVYLEAENGKSVEGFNGQYNLHQFPFFPAANFLTVTIPVTAVDPHVWGPGTCFEFRSLTSYTMYNVEELLLLGCADKNFSIMYSNSMSRVWDPGQSWFVNSYFSTECSIIYHCILFTCPSIAYTIVGYYYDVKHEVLAANFKHTSILNLHYMIVLATMLLEWKVIMLRSGYWVKVQVEHPSAGYTLYGVIEMVEWAAHHGLHHSLGTALVFVILLSKCMVAGQVIMEFHLRMSKSFTVNQKEQDCNWLILVPTETIGGRRASNTSHRYFEVNISINSQEIDAKEEWCEKGIAAPASHRHLLLLKCITLLDTSHISKHPCHVISELSKINAVMSKLLQAANQIMILFLKDFACCSQVYNTPSCQMMFSDLNLEDKVLFGGGCIVVNQASSIRAYELEVVNEVGSSKIWECFTWDPGPISIWLKGKMSWKGGLCNC
ncbi:hypothetical protein KY285_035592 [Solanum tuberosum]|nr:hypothetical protein KY285_035592 [Solanum tuberosum]